MGETLLKLYCRIKCIWFISQKNWINGEEAKSTRIILVLNSWNSQLVCFHNYIKRRKVFNSLKSTSRKYKFKKIKQRLVLFGVIDYIAKKSSHLTGPFSYSYIKSKAMSGCQNKRSILNEFRVTRPLDKNFENPNRAEVRVRNIIGCLKWTSPYSIRIWLFCNESNFDHWVN